MRFISILIVFCVLFVHAQSDEETVVPLGFEVIASCADWDENNTIGYRGWSYGYSTNAQNFGEGPHFDGTQYYTQHNAQYQLPFVRGCSGGCQIRRAALKWTSTVSTPSLIMQGFLKYTGWCGNGIDAHIYSVAEERFIVSIGNLGGQRDVNETLSVNEGDEFVFSFGCGPGIGKETCWCDAFSMDVTFMAPIPTTTTVTTVTTTTTSTTIEGNGGGGGTSDEMTRAVTSGTGGPGSDDPSLQVDDDDDGVSTGVLIGAGISGTLLLLGIGFVLWAFAKKNRRTKSRNTTTASGRTIASHQHAASRSRKTSQTSLRRRSTRMGSATLHDLSMQMGPVYSAAPSVHAAPRVAAYVAAPYSPSGLRPKEEAPLYHQIPDVNTANSAMIGLERVRQANQYDSGVLILPKEVASEYTDLSTMTSSAQSQLHNGNHYQNAYQQGPLPMYSSAPLRANQR